MGRGAGVRCKKKADVTRASTHHGMTSGRDRTSKNSVFPSVPSPRLPSPIDHALAQAIWPTFGRDQVIWSPPGNLVQCCKNVVEVIWPSLLIFQRYSGPPILVLQAFWSSNSRNQVFCPYAKRKSQI